MVNSNGAEQMFHMLTVMVAGSVPRLWCECQSREAGACEWQALAGSHQSSAD